VSADLDAAVPGWRGMGLPAFRLALQAVAGRHRAALREAFDAHAAAPVAPPPAAPEAVAAPPPAPAKPPRRGPGVLTPTPPKEG
jgi:hypothetical protein